MKYQVKITSIQTHTLDVLAENRYEALKKAKETLKHADPSEYRTELESIAHITMLEVGSGYEWMIRETPSSIAWRRTKTDDNQKIPAGRNDQTSGGSGDNVSPQE
jgi:hypothetical protein